MLNIFLLVVYEKDQEILRTYGCKTNILKTLNVIMKDSNKDMTYTITHLQK